MYSLQFWSSSWQSHVAIFQFYAQLQRDIVLSIQGARWSLAIVLICKYASGSSSYVTVMFIQVICLYIFHVSLKW